MIASLQRTHVRDLSRPVYIFLLFLIFFMLLSSFFFFYLMTVCSCTYIYVLAFWRSLINSSLSFRPSALLFICPLVRSLVFLDIVHEVREPWQLKGDRARFFGGKFELFFKCGKKAQNGLKIKVFRFFRNFWCYFLLELV